MAHIRNPSEVKTPTILAIEGNDDSEFFTLLIRNMRLEQKIATWVLGDKTSPSIQDQLKALFRSPLVGIDRLANIGILLDADNDDGISLKNIQQALAELKLPVPQTLNQVATGTEPFRGEAISIIAAALPGNLETLLMGVLENDPVIKCASDFLDCTQATRPALKPRFVAKATFHAYLEAKAVSKGKPIAGIRDLPQVKGWDWKHPLMDDLKAFLRQIATLT
jgi:hypothetical protein